MRYTHSAPDLALAEGHSQNFLCISCKKYTKEHGDVVVASFISLVPVCQAAQPSSIPLLLLSDRNPLRWAFCPVKSNANPPPLMEIKRCGLTHLLVVRVPATITAAASSDIHRGSGRPLGTRIIVILRSMATKDLKRFFAALRMTVTTSRIGRI